MDIIHYSYIWQRLFMFLQEKRNVIKKLFLGAVVVFALIIGGISAYISTIDWNQHKGKIAEQFENITGKRVVFDGNVSMSIFPTPYLTAKNIKIYNPKSKSPQPLAVINEMVTDLSLMPLLKGRFVVNNMSLLNPNILIEFDQDGQVNWASDNSETQQETFDDIDVLLNSVMLKDASVQIINPGLNVDMTLQNLNAEVTAQSLRGPYRIDGNFVKDNNPAGFALTLGTLSDSFSTSLNLVLTHPNTESYARFDGSMLPSNNEISGNFIIESKKPSVFINQITGQTILPQEFNYPLAVSVEIKTNKQQVDLSSFVVKYGDDTAGAGNILIPLRPKMDEDKATVEAGFEMTDLDLQPIVGILKELVKKYDDPNARFEPALDFNLNVSLKAVQATYNNQSVRNLNLSANIIDDILTVKSLSGLLPGDTDFQASGSVFENEKTLSYDFKVKSMSQDFLKFINWLNIKPQTYQNSTYRNALIDTRVSGTLHQIKISPINFNIDKTSGSGVVGIIRKDETKFFIALMADNINFDNYLPPLSDELKKMSLNDRIKSILNKFEFLNKYDLHFETKLAKATYNKVGFDNLNTYFDTQKGTVIIKDMSFTKAADAGLKLSGNVSGLGSNPSFENMKYEFATENFTAFNDAFNLPVPNWPLIQKAKKVSAQGIFTGDLNDATIKAVTAIDKLNSVYSGKLYAYGNKLNFNGTLEFKTPDFTDFIRQLGFNYNPKNMPANIFTFKSDIAGNADNWKAVDLNAFVGTNNFSGKIENSRVNGRNTIIADINANKFEFDRFIYNPAAGNITLKFASENADFFKKPLFDKNAVDYSLFKTFDMVGDFKVVDFNYGTSYYKNLQTSLEIKNGVINVKKLQFNDDEALVDGAFTLNVNDTPQISGNINLSNVNLSNLGGSKYAFTSGMLRAKTEFSAPATSMYDFISKLNGKISFDIDNAVFKGWDMEFIEDDLSKRTHSDDLFEMLKTNLQKGSSNFELIGAEINIKDSEYTFKDALMASGLVTIDIAGKGSLKDWNTDAVFKVVFERLRDKILPIEFKWTGSLTNPVLIIDATDLKNKYDEYWAKVAKEKREAEAARIKALKDRMSAAQTKVAALKNKVATEILPRIEKYKPLSSNADIKSRYDSNHLIVIDINNQLDMMAEKAKQDFTDDDITEMNAKIESFTPQLTDMVKTLDETFAYDVKMHSGDAYNTIKSIYDNSKIKSVNYQKTLDAYVLRLLQLGSMVVLDRDPKTVDYKSQIEQAIRKLEDINSQANETRTAIEETSDLNKLEDLHKIMQDLLKQSQQELERLNTSLEELFAYARNLVRQEEYGDNAPEYGNDTSETINEQAQDETSTPEDIKVEEPQQTTVLKPMEPEQQAESNVTKVETTQDLKEVLTKNQPTQNIVSYRSKLAPSGTLTVGKKEVKVQEKKAFTDKPASGLLKPITSDSITSGGTITKKN